MDDKAQSQAFDAWKSKEMDDARNCEITLDNNAIFLARRAWLASAEFERQRRSTEAASSTIRLADDQLRAIAAALILAPRVTSDYAPGAEWAVARANVLLGELAQLEAAERRRHDH